MSLGSDYLSLSLRRGGGGGTALVVGSNLPPVFGSYVPGFGSAILVPLASSTRICGVEGGYVGQATSVGFQRHGQLGATAAVGVTEVLSQSVGHCVAADPEHVPASRNRRDTRVSKVSRVIWSGRGLPVSNVHLPAAQWGLPPLLGTADLPDRARPCRGRTDRPGGRECQPRLCTARHRAGGRAQCRSSRACRCSWVRSSVAWRRFKPARSPALHTFSQASWAAWRLASPRCCPACRRATVTRRAAIALVARS
jgi:hypothetical protein